MRVMLGKLKCAIQKLTRMYIGNHATMSKIITVHNSFTCNTLVQVTWDLILIETRLLTEFIKFISMNTMPIYYLSNPVQEIWVNLPLS
jgi:hypothetical protein